MQVGIPRGSFARFHEFLVDMRTGELRHDSGEVIRLQAKPRQERMKAEARAPFVTSSTISLSDQWSN